MMHGRMSYGPESKSRRRRRREYGAGGKCMHRLLNFVLKHESCALTGMNSTGCACACLKRKMKPLYGRMFLFFFFKVCRDA